MICMCGVCGVCGVGGGFGMGLGIDLRKGTVVIVDVGGYLIPSCRAKLQLLIAGL